MVYPLKINIFVVNVVEISHVEAVICLPVPRIEYHTLYPVVSTPKQLILFPIEYCVENGIHVFLNSIDSAEEHCEFAGIVQSPRISIFNIKSPPVPSKPCNSNKYCSSEEQNINLEVKLSKSVHPSLFGQDSFVSSFFAMQVISEQFEFPTNKDSAVSKHEPHVSTEIILFCGTCIENQDPFSVFVF